VGNKDSVDKVDYYEILEYSRRSRSNTPANREKS